jgi:hypothetical protein
MAAQYNISIDQSQLRDVREMISGIANGAKTVQVRAVNDTASKMKSYSTKRIRKDLPTKTAKTINQSAGIVRAYAGQASPQSVLYIKGRPLSADSTIFRMSQLRKGAKLKIKKQKTLKEGEIRTGRTGKKKVYIPKKYHPKYRNQNLSPRERNQMAVIGWTSRVPDIAENAEVLRDIQGNAIAYLELATLEQAEKLLARYTR